jgi:hypothetical protein
MSLSFTIAAGPRQRSHSQVRIPWNSWTYFTLSNSRLPQPGGQDPLIYIPHEQGGPVIPPGTGFPFRRLLLLAGPRWRYSTAPPLLLCVDSLLQRRGPTENAACNTSLIVAWRHSKHDAFLCYVCKGHYLATAVSLPPQFLLWANTPQYIKKTEIWIWRTELYKISLEILIAAYKWWTTSWIIRM